MNILAIIQARVNSTRLPKKVLLKLVDKTVLEHVISRVKRSKFISDTIVATTVKKEDWKIVKLCQKNNLKYFCGSENDVLDRFYQVAKSLKPKHIVRITADCPLIDPEIIDKVISLHLKKRADYTSNVLKPTFPDGEDVEVFKTSILKKLWQKTDRSSEKEHVTLYIKNHQNMFKISHLVNKINLSNHRWTLDTQEDFKFIKIIFDNLYTKNHYFAITNILNFLKKHKTIALINSHIKRNEGLQKSLSEDKIIKINYE